MQRILSQELGAGVGLRTCHYSWVLKHRPRVPFFEVISENFMIPGGKPLHVLDQVRKHYPISLHGVSMSLGSKDPLRQDYLQKLKALIDRVEPLWVSDHLCWTGVHGFNGHDLWPLPYTEESIEHIVEKIQRAQDFLGRQMMIENLSTYLEFQESEMSEWEFLREIVERADCGILCDINNIFVTAHNHGIDGKAYLDHLPKERIFEIHLAGPSERGDLLIDTHDHPVQPQAWELYEYFLSQAGPRPTLIEWDDNIPEFSVLWEEAQKAQGRIDAETRGNPEAILATHSGP